MFTTFLIGTALTVGVVMLALLVQPKPKADRAADMPYVGVTLAILLAALALVGGLAVSG